MSSAQSTVEYGLHEMNHRERVAIRAAETVAREVLAENARRYDEAAEFPRDSFDALRDAGLVGVVVPERYGGLELRPHAYSVFLRALARGCASTAASFHMHNAAMLFLRVVGTREQHEHYFAEAVQGHLFGSWGAEPMTSWAGTVALNTAYENVDGGYVITGSKYFCSLGEGASYGLLYAVHADRAESANLEHVQFFFVDVNDPGVTIVDQWDPLGLRATVSKPVKLDRCHVPPIGRIGEPGAVQDVPTEFYSLGYASFYSAIAEEAYAWAVSYAQTRTTMPSNQPIATFERIQRKIGTMALYVHQSVLAVEHVARYMTWEHADRAASVVAALKAKAIATRSALEVTSLAIEVAGGPGALRGHPAERYFRDARTATLMVPAYDQAVETLAKNELGYADELLH